MTEVEPADPYLEVGNQHIAALLMIRVAYGIVNRHATDVGSKACVGQVARSDLAIKPAAATYGTYAGLVPEGSQDALYARCCCCCCWCCWYGWLMLPPPVTGGATPPVTPRCLIFTFRSATLAALRGPHKAPRTRTEAKAKCGIDTAAAVTTWAQRLH